jgi:hypothetical protein
LVPSAPTKSQTNETLPGLFCANDEVPQDFQSTAGGLRTINAKLEKMLRNFVT